MSRWPRRLSFSRRNARSSASISSTVRTGAAGPYCLRQSRRFQWLTPKSYANCITDLSLFNISATASRLNVSS